MEGFGFEVGNLSILFFASSLSLFQIIEDV